MNSLNEKRQFQVEEGVLIFLLLLSLAGIIITDYSPLDGYTYWLIIVLIFAVLAIFIAWLQDKQHNLDNFADILKEQAMHWGASLLTIGGVFLLQKAELLTEINGTPVILLILSLATILDGIRIGWRFSLVGFFLGISAIVIAYSEYFLLVTSLIALLIVGFTIALEFWLHKKRYLS